MNKPTKKKIIVGVKHILENELCTVSAIFQAYIKPFDNKTNIPHL